MKNPMSRILPLATAVLIAAGCASNPPAQETKSETAQTKPAATTAAAPAAAASNANRMSYNVVRGDHLWGIAGKPTIYGNPYNWPLIFKANRDQIKDADVIEPGQVLSIDKNPSNADIDAAMKHAKTRGEWSIGKTERSDLDYLSRYGQK